MQQHSLADPWPPDYVEAYRWRQAQHRLVSSDPAKLRGALEYYRTHPVEFINHWCITYDPRNAGTEGATPSMPFLMFPKQAELVEFLCACIKGEENALIEKCRDMGATWVCCAFSVWVWLFWPGASVGWGSRKEQYVDKIGDPDSIFEKMRMLIGGLPGWFLPPGLSNDKHLTYMKFINPATGATITGEAGDNIGRGGRKLMYFKDESAHYERPEKIEAALADNTRVQVDISSVNGLGNVFHRRREAGAEWDAGRGIQKGRTQIFIMDWRDHPAKTEDWYRARKAKAEEEGLAHVFAQEVDRNYAASVDGVIIPADWVKAAIDAHIKLKWPESNVWGSGLDIADGGGDRNAQVKRRGPVLTYADEWGARDTAETARRAVANCDGLGRVEIQYDCIGVGSGVKAEANNLADAGNMPKGIRLIPWNAGAAVLDPDRPVIEGDRDSPLNKDFYANLKAQGWWELRNRFYRTWRAVEKGADHNPDMMISLDSKLPLLRQVEKELSQATASKGARMKLVVDKTPEGTRSPNLADAIVMAFWPAPGGSKYTLANING